MNYYSLSNPIKKNTAFAYTLKEVPEDNEFILTLQGKNELPFEMGLKKVDLIKGDIIVTDDLSNVKYVWLDYQPNNQAWPLMSERMKVIIENKLIGKEDIDWIIAKVNGKGEKRTYYIPRFNTKLDVLDKQKTIFASGTDHVVIPCFSLSKIRNYTLFSKPQAFELWRITSSLYISEFLKETMQKEKLTGVGFENAKVV